MFSKVKAVVVVLVLAGLAGIGPAVAGVDWGAFGSFGPAIGLAVGAIVAYAVKETKFYGGGNPDAPPKPDTGDSASSQLP